MTVLNFPRHKAFVCNCTRPICQFCDGGLFLCVRCNSAEGATTTDCPGEEMTVEQIELVYDGRLDYDRRLGWIERDVHARRG